MVWLGEGYLLSGRVEESGALAERALDLSAKHGERGHEAWALKLLGDISLQRKPAKTEEAETTTDERTRLATSLGCVHSKHTVMSD